MLARAHPLALLLALVLSWTGGLRAQEQEVFKGQAGLYPLRAYLTKSAVVGPAHLVVEIGEPKKLAVLPKHPGAQKPETASVPPPLEVAAILDMPDMAATKPTNVKLADKGPKRFEGDILITMKGDWRIQLVVDTPEGEYRPLARFTVGAQAAARQEGGESKGGLELCAPGEGDDLPLEIHCSPDPARVGSNRLRIEFPKQGGGTATVPMMVGIDMPGMAVALPPRQAVRQEDGSYEAVVDLPMAGYWQVRVDLNGRVLPPFALTVEEAHSGGPSRPLLALLLICSMPAFVWWFVRRRRLALAPIAVCATVLLSTLAAGLVIEHRWPADTSMGMHMDMLASDMGMGQLAAPHPVMELKLQKAPFVVTRDYPGTVAAARETLVLSPRSGVLTEIAPAGSYAQAGTVLARVGQDGEVRAASAGVVVRSLLGVGAEVAGGTPLLALGDTREVAVRARAPLADRGLLSGGLEVEVADSEGQESRGKLTSISALSQGSTFEIAAVVDNTRARVVPHNDSSGMVQAGPTASKALQFGTFSIGQDVLLRCAIESVASAISVPKTAVWEASDGSKSVFVVQRAAGHRIARRQGVTLGSSSDARVQIVSGLSEGQIIVANVEPSLRDGDLVVPATLGEGVYRALVLPDMGSH